MTEKQFVERAFQILNLTVSTSGTKRTVWNALALFDCTRYVNDDMRLPSSKTPGMLKRQDL